jgi:hypothetical protein
MTSSTSARLRLRRGPEHVPRAPPMSDVNLQFARVSADGEILWHVHRGGRFVGSIAEVERSCRASVLIAGELRTRRFADRDTAALWLVTLAGA